MDNISQQERAAIDLYKSYQRDYLPNVRTLEGLYAPDFDPTAYPGDNLDALGQYLADLRAWTSAISTAAQLRQDHFENFIRDRRDEDNGHRIWREGMCEIAADARAKLQHWSRMYDLGWDVACSASHEHVTIDFTAKNCDYSWNCNRGGSHRPPKMSARERARVRKEYRARLLEEQREIELAIKANEPYRKVIADFDKYHPSLATRVSASDIRDQVLLGGVMKLADYISHVQEKTAMSIVGSHDEFIDMTAAIITEAVSIQLELCCSYGCAITLGGREFAIRADNTVNADTVSTDVSAACVNTDASAACVNTVNTVNTDTSAASASTVNTRTVEFLAADAYAYEYVHKCDHVSGSRDHDFTTKIGTLTEIVRTLTLSGGDLLVSTIMDELCVNRAFNINSRIVILLLNAIAGEMNDEIFIRYIKMSADIQNEIRENIQRIARTDDLVSKKSEKVSKYMAEYRRLQELTRHFALVYPMSRYFSVVQLIEIAIHKSQTICYSHVKRHGRAAIDPPVINYKKIKKETGVKLIMPAEAIRKYRHARKLFDAALKDEFRRLSAQARDH